MFTDRPHFQVGTLSLCSSRHFRPNSLSLNMASLPVCHSRRLLSVTTRGRKTLHRASVEEFSLSFRIPNKLSWEKRNVRNVSLACRIDLYVRLIKNNCRKCRWRAVGDNRNIFSVDFITDSFVRTRE